jgi:hypothetical protein
MLRRAAHCHRADPAPPCRCGDSVHSAIVMLVAPQNNAHRRPLLPLSFWSAIVAGALCGVATTVRWMIVNGRAESPPTKRRFLLLLRERPREWRAGARRRSRARARELPQPWMRAAARRRPLVAAQHTPSSTPSHRTHTSRGRDVRERDSTPNQPRRAAALHIRASRASSSSHRVVVRRPRCLDGGFSASASQPPPRPGIRRRPPPSRPRPLAAPALPVFLTRARRPHIVLVGTPERLHTRLTY